MTIADKRAAPRHNPPSGPQEPMMRPILAAFAAILASLALPASPGAAQEGAAPPAAIDPAAQPLFALMLAPGPAWKPGRPFAEQGLRPHFDYWMALFRQGRIASAGPVGSDSGLVLLRAADQAAADAILAADPAIMAGIFTGTVRPYAPPMVNADALDPAHLKMVEGALGRAARKEGVGCDDTR